MSNEESDALLKEITRIADALEEQNRLVKRVITMDEQLLSWRKEEQRQQQRRIGMTEKEVQAELAKREEQKI